MPVVNREGFTVRILRTGAASGTGLGLLLTDRHVVTCAHVVNEALGRDRLAQDEPSGGTLIQVEFPLLGDAEGGPVRSCTVRRWVPPPLFGALGGDVAVLEMARGDLPRGAGPARAVDPAGLRGAFADTFGYPAAPDRGQGGAWSRQLLRGSVGNGALQLDLSSESAIRAQPGYSGSPVVVTESGSDAVAGILSAAPREGRDAYAIPVPVIADVWPEALGQVLMPESPYRWLSAFSRADAREGLFVGREREAADLRRMADRESLVVVTGPSGVGKSSLLAAGLGRTLEDAGWAVAPVRPGTMPTDALGAALMKLEGPAPDRTVRGLRRYVRGLRSRGLADLGGELALTTGKPIVICVDPLDDIFNENACSPEARVEFLEIILSAADSPPGTIQVACALRSDLMPALLEHPESSSRLQGRFYMLSPLGRERIMRVIDEPAAKAGVRYDDGLAAVMADDAGSGGSLPLLEFALAELWPCQRQRHIKLDDYVSLGRVSGALSRRAEQVYRELEAEFSDEQIRKVLLSFVAQAPAGSTHKPVPRVRFTRKQQEIIARLVESRLMVSRKDEAADEDVYEIPHAALLENWARLSGWIATDRIFLDWHSQMRSFGTSHLLPESRLAEARNWLAERAEDIDADIRLMIERSQTHYERQLRELEEARDRAELAARRADSLRLASLSEQAAVARSPAAVALAVESLLKFHTVQGDMALRRALAHAAQPSVLPGNTMGINAISFSRDGELIVTAGEDGVVRIFSGSGDPHSSYSHSGPVKHAAFSDSGEWVIGAGSTGQVFVVESATGKLLWRINHDDSINGVTFSPDGRLAATACDDGIARVFNWSSEARIAEVAHHGRVTAVRFSPDGKTIATASDDGFARICVLGPRKKVFRLPRAGPLNSVTFSASGTLIATASSDGYVRIFDAQTRAGRGRIKLGSPAVTAVFSHGGALVALTGGAPGQGAVRVQRLADGKVMLERVDREPVGCAAFSHDDELIVVAGKSGAVRVFEVSTGVEWTGVKHDGPVASVDFSPRARKAASAGVLEGALLFDPGPGPERYRVLHDGAVSHVEFVPGSGLLMSASSDGMVFLSDVATGDLAQTIRHRAAVNAVLMSPAGHFVATAGKDAVARLFDLSTGTERSLVAHDGEVRSLAFSRDGAWLATGSGDRTARLLHVQTGRLRLTIPHRGPVTSMDISADGRWLATVNGGRAEDIAAHIFAIDSGALVFSFPHRARVNRVAFSPDGSLLATASDDGSARIFDTASGKLRAQLKHAERVGAISFSQDGSRIVTASDDGSARVYDTATHEERSRLIHDGWVNAAVFSESDGLVATASDDGTARVFDPATGLERNRLIHDLPVRAVAVSPDGEWLATAGDDRVVRVSAVGLQSLLASAQSRMSRPLTTGEQQRYDTDPQIDKSDTAVSSGGSPSGSDARRSRRARDLASFNWYRIQDSIILEMSGELDVTNAQQIYDLLDDLIGRECFALILDISEVRFMDSSALGPVLRANRELDRQGRILAMAGPRGPVRKMLRLTGADQLLPVYDTLEQALGNN